MNQEGPQINQEKEERLAREAVELVIKEEKELTAISRVFINGLLMVINTAYQGDNISKDEKIKFLEALDSGVTQAIAALRERVEKSEEGVVSTPEQTI